MIGGSRGYLDDNDTIALLSLANSLGYEVDLGVFILNISDMLDIGLPLYEIILKTPLLFSDKSFNFCKSAARLADNASAVFLINILYRRQELVEFLKYDHPAPLNYQ